MTQIYAVTFSYFIVSMINQCFFLVFVCQKSMLESMFLYTRWKQKMEMSKREI